jgi:hypothetical protein
MTDGQPRQRAMNKAVADRQTVRAALKSVARRVEALQNQTVILAATSRRAPEDTAGLVAELVDDIATLRVHFD